MIYEYFSLASFLLLIPLVKLQYDELQNHLIGKKRIAIIGAGVIGISSALAILEEGIDAEIVVFSDLPFEKTTSWGPAGLFRIDNGMYRNWGNITFGRYSKLFRDIGGSTGIQKLSGYILSEDIEKLKLQERNYADIVYDFHFLSPRELHQFSCERTNLSGIHFTAYTTEGRKYVPWMSERLKAAGVQFVNRHVSSALELINEGFDVVVNCAGLRGGEVAGDGDAVNVYPIRGVLFQVEAPWQKHFLYEDFATFTIPTINSVYMGTIKMVNGMNMFVSPEEREDVRQRYIKLQPAFKDVPIISEWVGFRPARDVIRLEAVPFNNDLVIHNYGHSGNGFTLSWGCAMEVVSMIKKHFR